SHTQRSRFLGKAPVRRTGDSSGTLARKKCGDEPHSELEYAKQAGSCTLSNVMDHSRIPDVIHQRIDS
ncbi:MAG: hypothetical protein ABI619_12375, partial [Betaproteobacteria bacterium]